MTDAEAAARAIINIFATGDLASISAAVADDYVDHQGLGEIEIRGPQGFRHVVEAVHRRRDVSVTIQDIVSSQDKAAMRIRWYGVDSDGRGVTRETLDLLRFVDDRLAEHWGAQLFRSVSEPPRP